MRSLYEKAIESQVKNFFVVRTFDFRRVLRKIIRAVQEVNIRKNTDYRPVISASGLENIEGERDVHKSEVATALKNKAHLVYIFRNRMPFEPDDIVQITEKHGLEGCPTKIFIVSPDIEFPFWLRPHVEEIEDYFPTQEEVEGLEYAEGLTLLELHKAREEGDLIAYRERILRQSGGILEVFRPKNVDRAVGLAEVLELLEKLYQSGIGKGTLLLGVPGTGKTLIAKNLAIKYPVVRLNVSAVYSKYVGESEARLRSALKTLEQFGKCFVFIDEIEKALAQHQGSGVDARVLGELLSFLQDRDTPQYFIATANQIRRLPLEVIRPERWDFILGLTPPPSYIRNQMIDYYAQKYSLPFDQKLAEIKNLTPADISAIYRLGSVIGLEKAKRYVKLTKDLAEHFEESLELVKKYAVPVYEEEAHELI